MIPLKNLKVNRSFSSPTDCRIHATSEEVKDLFTDPALRKGINAEKMQNKKKEKYCSSMFDGSIVSSDIEATSPTVKVVTPEFHLAANSLMTRRITIAGGFLDIALFTANCEQLKFVLELGSFHIYYNHVLGLLIASLVLQLLVGLTMFLLGCQTRYKVNDETYSNYLNHITMGLVALITIVNIFIGTFGPKGTVMARCLGAFAYPNTAGPVWMAYLNETRNYMAKAN